MALTAEEKHGLRVASYFAGFFLSIGVAIAAYVNSSFIEQFVGERSVGLIYVIISVLSIIISFNTDALIKKIGNRQALIILTIANLVAIIGLVAYHNAALVVPFFIAYSVCNFLIVVNLDLYLEEISDDRITGKIRGLFLTLNNLAWLCSPLLAGFLANGRGYNTVYFASGLAFIPLLYLIVFQFRNIPRETFEHAGIYQALVRLWQAKDGVDVNIRRIIGMDLLLNFFYATMIIYMPIYLHNHIGLPWDKLGIIFTIMLVPFVLLDFLLGWIADSWWGEKELLVTGIVITAFATLLIPLLGSTSVILWGVILFITRIGAATIEIMKETYLFKQIDGRNIDVVFVSRNMYPLSYILAPLIAMIWLAFLPYQYLFGLLGVIMLLGLPTAISLKDTR